VAGIAVDHLDSPAAEQTGQRMMATQGRRFYLRMSAGSIGRAESSRERRCSQSDSSGFTLQTATVTRRKVAGMDAASGR
jgi:hypothetical protein